MTNTSVNAANIFQSTHPVRGATPVLSTCAFIESDFNPRTP